MMCCGGFLLANMACGKGLHGTRWGMRDEEWGRDWLKEKSWGGEAGQGRAGRRRRAKPKDSNTE